jgi:uncharacterized protein (DUF4415 family)
MKKIIEAPELHDTAGTEDWTEDDGEIRELTEADFATMVPFAKLPQEMQEFLLQIKDATIRPDPLPEPAEVVTLKLSSPVLARFRATGTGWESRVDEALLQWMEEHKAS